MKHGVAYFELKQEIEEFLYQEADLLEAENFASGSICWRTIWSTSCRSAAT